MSETTREPGFYWVIAPELDNWDRLRVQPAEWRPSGYPDSWYICGWDVGLEDRDLEVISRLQPPVTE